MGRERFVLSGLIPTLELQYHLSRYQFASGFAVGKEVLDVACGTGYGASLLSRVASHVVGVDISSDALQFAIQRHQDANLEYLCADAHALPFREGGFEAIVALEMIEHLAEPQIFLEECVRVLRPGGILVVSTPNKDGHFWLSSFAQENKLLRTLLGYVPALSRLLVNPFHRREFSYGELKQLVSAHLEVIGFYGISRLSRSGLYTVICRIPGFGRAMWEVTKLARFVKVLSGGGPLVDANAVALRSDALVEAPFIPFTLSGPAPVEYFMIVGRKPVIPAALAQPVRT